MDDVIYAEYKAGVIALSDDAKQQQSINLSTLLWPLVETAANNISAGNSNTIFLGLVKCVAESI